MPVTGDSMTQAVVGLYASVPVQTPPLPTQLYFVELPEDVPQLPVAQYRHSGEPPIPGAYPTGAPLPVALEGRFSITLWGLDMVQLEAWAKAIMTTFAPTALAITGASAPNTVLFRTDYRLDAAGLRNYQGNPVRTVMMSWKLFISNPPA